MLFYKESIEDTLKKLETGEQGLSHHDIIVRQKYYGPNTFSFKKEPLWRKLIEPFANIFMAVLLVAVVISLFEKAWLDAIIISVIMIVSAIIYYVQQFSTQRILASLKKHNELRIEVIRDGENTVISDIELVPGDIIKLYEGDKVPADIRLIHADSVQADESILTGESVPVQKNSDTLHAEKAIYEQTNTLFQGTFLTSGRAFGVVIATGNQTEFGRIATLTNDQFSVSPVQKKIDKLISYIIAVVIIIAIIAFGLAVYRGIGFAEALRFVIALSVSAVPENLPVAISIILVLGMRRMAVKKALVKEMQAIETIGLVTTIATDKTGTLTKNQLRVQEVWQPKHSKHHLETIVHKSVNRDKDNQHDPLDVAMIEFVAAKSVVELTGTPVIRLPFDQSYSMSGNIWHHDGNYELTIKGAPEQIISRSEMTSEQIKEAEVELHKMTSMGYRVIALATIKLNNKINGFKELKKTHKMSFVGFLAIADTLRPSARLAIERAQAAGITVRMITGDHYETAYSIGQQLGLVNSREQVFDSRSMDSLTDQQLKKQIQIARVFSRVTPENKYRLLKVFKKSEIIAMTGDGVNDVPALTNAHVGIAMGSGSQIAKDAGDIILLNNNFKSIIDAVREGRVIFSNIRRMLLYLLSTNTGEVLTTICSLVIGLPMPILPVQILWINLVTDTAMVIPLGLEPGEREVMKRPPTEPSAPLLGKYAISRMIVIAITMAILAIGVYIFFINHNYEIDYARTMAFVSLVTIQWANAFNVRSTFQSLLGRLKVLNKSFYIGLSLAIILQILAIFGPLRDILQLAETSLIDVAIVTIISFVAPIVIVEIHKLFGRIFIKKMI